jgi:hypothetical protein
VVGVYSWAAVHEHTGFDLLHPDLFVFTHASSRSPLPFVVRQAAAHAARAEDFAVRCLRSEHVRLFEPVLAELNDTFLSRRAHVDRLCEDVRPNIAAVVQQTIVNIEARELLAEKSKTLKEDFKDVFGAIPHIDELPTDITCGIRLKDATRRIESRSYASPKKYREAWNVLIKRHLDAGRIRPSSSQFAFPAFLIPKSDPKALPRWVNDFRMLNANTVPDRFPLKRIDEILGDCGKGKIWGKIDMTDSFFQTRLDESIIPYFAVNTPLGLYEWTVMPQGFRNDPPVQQRRMTTALRPFLGVFCHIYVDDIIIWSSSIEEHECHVRTILSALRKHKLFCNPLKCEFFLSELDFLGHHISARGIEAQNNKCSAILDFPRPKSASEVRHFLGLVRFVASFLGTRLAEFTRVLSPLTRKECERVFPAWTDEHEDAFTAIKRLVTSREVLTVIDHDNPGDNKIFLVCDASDWRTGGILMWGPDLDHARPVAFDSVQLNPAEKNYPVHEKELLAIVRGLKKWRADCLGMPVYVMTDHRTLENFESQKDLSRRQLRWQEFMSQYDLKIAYIKGEDNPGADCLSRVPPDAYPLEAPVASVMPLEPVYGWQSVNAVLRISADESFLRDIQAGYEVDPFIAKIRGNLSVVPGVHKRGNLWFWNDHLIIPRYRSLRENLFRLVHDESGHFGPDKCYDKLRSSFYWPNMRKDLFNSYVPGCDACQRFKGATRNSKGPLHPLPVPEKRGDSVAMDFIGPLPLDDGFDAVLTITCRLNSDVRVIPTNMSLTAEQAAQLFFDHWYCENGLPLDIVTDRDKLWTSCFWDALARLTGVTLKMSTAFHPETDGSSERSNKTVNQTIRFYVKRTQKGWAQNLPRVRFQIMNSLNASTGMTMFELKTGRIPRVLPPLVTDAMVSPVDNVAASSFIDRMRIIEADAQDALLAAKVLQAHCANKTRSGKEVFAVGDLVMLTTVHRRREYKKQGELRVAKFFPRFDGPYKVISAHSETDSYRLEMPPSSRVHPVFYIDQLKKYVPNDPALFPGRELPDPPTMDVDGVSEHFIDRILDSKRVGRGWKFLVRWVGFGPDHDEWFNASALSDCAALDVWYASGGDGPDADDSI